MSSERVDSIQICYKVNQNSIKLKCSSKCLRIVKNSRVDYKPAGLYVLSLVVFISRWFFNRLTSVKHEVQLQVDHLYCSECN